MATPSEGMTKHHIRLYIHSYHYESISGIFIFSVIITETIDIRVYSNIYAETLYTR